MWVPRNRSFTNLHIKMEQGVCWKMTCMKVCLNIHFLPGVIMTLNHTWYFRKLCNGPGLSYYGSILLLCTLFLGTFKVSIILSRSLYSLHPRTNDSLWFCRRIIAWNAFSHCREPAKRSRHFDLSAGVLSSMTCDENSLFFSLESDFGIFAFDLESPAVKAGFDMSTPSGKKLIFTMRGVEQWYISLQKSEEGVLHKRLIKAPTEKFEWECQRMLKVVPRQLIDLTVSVYEGNLDKT